MVGRFSKNGAFLPIYSGKVYGGGNEASSALGFNASLYNDTYGRTEYVRPSSIHVSYFLKW